MAKNPDTDFYVTCATVIPVLFLALALQGRPYDSLIRANWKAARTSSTGKALRQRLLLRFFNAVTTGIE
jgi:hypothetical protein